MLFFDPEIKRYPPRPKAAEKGAEVVEIPFESRILSAKQISSMKEALAYWEEAIEEASKPDDNKEGVRIVILLASIVSWYIYSIICVYDDMYRIPPATQYYDV
jgi:hypothetical protein